MNERDERAPDPLEDTLLDTINFVVLTAGLLEDMKRKGEKTTCRQD